jgi:hypothetical protein
MKLGRIGWIAVAVGGAAAVGAVAYLASGGAATAGSASNGLAAGLQTFTAKAGQTVTLTLPTGASWIAGVGGLATTTSPAAGTSTPWTFTAPAAGSYTLSASWSDAGGLPVGDVITLTVT